VTLILKVTSGNEFCDGGCEFAVVTLNPELAGLALRRIAGLREQRRLDAELDEEYYWAYLGLEYFRPWGEVTRTQGEGSGDSVSLADRLRELRIEDNGIVTVPESFQVPPSLVAAVECEQMIVRQLGRLLGHPETRELLRPDCRDTSHHARSSGTDRTFKSALLTSGLSAPS
jgi:hypothetical protein